MKSENQQKNCTSYVQTNIQKKFTSCVQSENQQKNLHELHANKQFQKKFTSCVQSEDQQKKMICTCYMQTKYSKTINKLCTKRKSTKKSAQVTCQQKI